MTTCLRHRDLLGSRWQSGTPICTIPDEIAAHKSSSVKGLCGLRSNQSAYVYFTLSQLVPTGSHKSHGAVGSRPANDPSTANDPQIGPQTIPRQDPQGLYRKRWYLRRKSELADERNVDSGIWTGDLFQPFFFLKITNSQFKCNRCYR